MLSRLASSSSPFFRAAASPAVVPLRSGLLFRTLKSSSVSNSFAPTSKLFSTSSDNASIIQLLEEKDRKRDLRAKIKRLGKPSVEPPKAPLTAYVLFCGTRYKTIAESDPFKDIDKIDRSRAVATQLGKEWQALSQEEKEKFEAKSKINKKEYEVALATYLATRTQQDLLLDEKLRNLNMQLSPEKRHKRVLKDPLAPTKPLNMYNLFLSENGYMGKGVEGVKEGAEAWRLLGDVEKKAYQKKYDKSMVEYDNLKDKYDIENNIPAIKRKVGRDLKSAALATPLSPLENAKLQVEAESSVTHKKRKHD
ncbi:UNVERIFIED_CONTAM: exp1-like protein [Siphonaria sp. JEL0065]|nr:exp1-like protein [Siphonaria sp. JEL0065]